MVDNSVNNIYIGGIPGRHNSFFDGAMDEIRISTKMLEPKIQWDFEAEEIEGRLKADKDTIALWHFDRPRPLEDASGNGHTLIAQGRVATKIVRGYTLSNFGLVLSIRNARHDWIKVFGGRRKVRQRSWIYSPWNHL